jgi:hypothetical protein
MARAQALAKLGGQVNIVYVRAASAAAVGAVTGEISRLLPSARVTNSASLPAGWPDRCRPPRGWPAAPPP